MAVNAFELFASLSLDTSDYEKGLNDASSNASSFGEKLKGGLGAAAQAGAAALTAASAGVAALTKSSLDSYAEYEQLVGGVETLFEDLSVDIVDNASNAYTTAGLSANEYMETVMGFAASLTSSLKDSEGNIARAADASDQIIRDMSDNANKMGSSMESIQNAYSGFAKQNYTINLMSAA